MPKPNSALKSKNIKRPLLGLKFIFFEFSKNYNDTLEQIRTLCGKEPKNEAWISAMEALYSQFPERFKGIMLEVNRDWIDLTIRRDGTIYARTRLQIDSPDVKALLEVFINQNCNYITESTPNEVEPPNFEERNNRVTILRNTLEGNQPSTERQMEISQFYQQTLAAKLNDPPMTYFQSIPERAYWEKLQFPQLWEEMQNTLDAELSSFISTGEVGDELRHVIAEIYFFGNLVLRPIFLEDSYTLDSTDEKLMFSTPIGTAIDTSRFVQQSGAQKVLEVFTGRGNLTLLLSLIGTQELFTVERDTYLDIASGWYCSIEEFHKNIPEVFWPKITVPIFISGDVFDTALPTSDCVIMDPPYGRASFDSLPEAHALLFLLDVLASVQAKGVENIYSLAPAEWTSILRLFLENPPRDESSYIQAIEDILQTSKYFQRKPARLDAFVKAIREDKDYIKKLSCKTEYIKNCALLGSTPIKNVLGKELDILQIGTLNNNLYQAPS